jgi:hypothetical protein
MPRATIAYTPAVFALKRLHAELGGAIKDNRKQAKRLTDDMKHVEAVLKMLQPGFDVRAIAAKRKNTANPYFKKGTVFRAVLGVLREAVAPLTSTEIVTALFRTRGIENASREDQRTMFGAVHSSLVNHAGKSIERVGDSKPARWKIADDL